jgi:hypothetical protein
MGIRRRSLCDKDIEHGCFAGTVLMRILLRNIGFSHNINSIVNFRERCTSRLASKFTRNDCRKALVCFVTTTSEELYTYFGEGEQA